MTNAAALRRAQRKNLSAVLASYFSTGFAVSVKMHIFAILYINVL